LHSIDFVERRRVRDKVKRERCKKKQDSFRGDLLAHVALFRFYRDHRSQPIFLFFGFDWYFNYRTAARERYD
jgi:hypothetical protein